MRKYGLKLNTDGVRSGANYSSTHQPGTRNEFSTFAFRVGHTLIPEGIMPLNKDFIKTSEKMFK